jgi:hypothetical protein
MSLKVPSGILLIQLKKFPDFVKLDPEDYKRLRSKTVYRSEGGWVYIIILGKIYSMQQAVTEFKWKLVDHKNGIPWDCRKDNLRESTSQQNQFNRVVNKNSSSGFKGVEFNPSSKRWRARITIGGKRKDIGSFATAEEANQAYMNYAKDVHKEFQVSQ